ncbi:uncharacterized protein LOC105384842 isoform X4 [Plutella xylostella]|uniref:uncharacterized protein LOC105384842 isoform X4 n=1 Tax=Plutella xylostella TaxID=51655 RepID=UPI002032A1CA|nr:uncharacterized protein LOC105384842 isoform X4 [Plutella xylostella]
MSTKPANQKRRNNDKRKEKSRVAARCRRNKEVQIFSELTAALPARKEDVEQLDKASIMRLAISYLKVRDVVALLPESTAKTAEPQPPSLDEVCSTLSQQSLEEVCSSLSHLRALDGFGIVLSRQGDVVYCSENIAEHLGVSQMEIMGQSVFEFSHPCEHDEIRDALRGGAGRRQLLLRFKCTLTGKGRNVYLKSASYKVIKLSGHLLVPTNDTSGGALVAAGCPIPQGAGGAGGAGAVSKHNTDMTFTSADDGLCSALGYSPEELVGRSLYEYHHAGDSAALAQQFKALFSKGQCETGQYRFLAKSGGYAWVQTQATLVTDKQQKPVAVVCVNHLISGIECRDEVFAAHQLQHADLKPPLDEEPALEVPTAAPEEERPIPVTESIFAPRNKEMNEGFLMFSQDEGRTMFKEEPEDLTHLAPTAGDACIPLENNVFEMLDEFILSDNYCSGFLGDAGSPGDSLGDSLAGDPFLISSPETQETDSSCEQSFLLTELSLDAFDARSDELDGGKSPFIPMADELPLLEPAVMWGALPEGVSLAKPAPSEPAPAPALRSLLAAPPTGPPPHDLITNIYSDQGLIPSRAVSSWDTGVKRVIKQEEAPAAKRARRSPSPPRAPQPAPQPAAPRSSVLMNLLDIPRPAQPIPSRVTLQPTANVGPIGPQQLLMQTRKLSPHAATPTVTQVPKIQVSPTTANTIRPITNPMSPLSLSIDTSMYGVYGRNCSPAISPAQKERLLSPYSTPPSMSPAEKYTIYSPSGTPTQVLQSNCDPYLTNKSVSPSIGLQRDTQQEMLMDPSMAADFWSDADMILTAFDDVRL